MKNTILFYLIISAFMFIACEKPYVTKPKDLLSKTEMIDILTDLYINQQIVSNVQFQSSNQMLDIAKNSLYIYKEHNTSYKTFENSYKYYFAQPEVYDKILDKVRKKIEDQIPEEEKSRITNTLEPIMNN